MSQASVSDLSDTRQTSTSLRVALLLTAGNGFLDAYTIITHDVFATTQTGNIVLFFRDLVTPDNDSAIRHVVPVLAFIVGVIVANAIQTERMRTLLRYPIRLALGFQIILLIIVATLPSTANVEVVTLMIGFGGGLQMGLFRMVRGNAYITLATTGNLKRLVEACYTAANTRKAEHFALARIYGAVVGCFVLGIIAGALGSHWWGTHAAWVAVALVLAALSIFFIDDATYHRRVGPADAEPDAA